MKNCERQGNLLKQLGLPSSYGPKAQPSHNDRERDWGKRSVKTEDQRYVQIKAVVLQVLTTNR